MSYERAVKVLREFDGIVEQATENELANSSARADKAGLFTCPQTGVALAALLKMIERKVIKKKDRVVVISTAHGLKFSQFKVDYHEKTLQEVDSHYANPPIMLPANVDAVRSAINKLIRK